LTNAARVNGRGDYYGILGVSRHASPQEIRRAYRRLARQCHPDLSDQTGSSDRFKMITEAYEVLHDPDARARYDRVRRPRRARWAGERHAAIEATLELSAAEAAVAWSAGLTLSDDRGWTIRLPARTRDGDRVRIAAAIPAPVSAPGPATIDLVLRVRVVRSQPDMLRRRFG
jgi:curved DNA-binding protein CbpA